MKIVYKITDGLHMRNISHEISFAGYPYFELLTSDLERIVDYHKFKYEAWKKQIVDLYGEEHLKNIIERDADYE